MTTESTVQQRSTLTPVSAEDLVGRVQELQAQLDAAGDPATREVAEELVSAVVQMYGAGLEKIFSALAAHGEVGGSIAAGLAEDPDVASLMLIHDLHPADKTVGRVLIGVQHSPVGVCWTFFTRPTPVYMCTPHGRHGSKLRTARMMSMPLKFSGPFSSKIGVFCTASS